MLTAVRLLVVLVMTAALAGLPFGLPGLWIILALLLGSAVVGWISWTLWLILAAVTVVVEVLEFAILARLASKFGGTRWAFVGALVGGLVGIFVGAPVLLVGSVIAGVLGTFSGAAVVTLAQRRSIRDAARVGWGVTLARILAIGLKVGVGVAVLVVGGGALLLP